MATTGDNNAPTPEVIDEEDQLQELEAVTITAAHLLLTGRFMSHNAANDTVPVDQEQIGNLMKTAEETQDQTLLQAGTSKGLKPTKTRAKRPPRNLDKPKKPMNCYLLFHHHCRETVKRDLGPNATLKEISGEIAMRWRRLTEVEKKVWKDIYTANLELSVRDRTLPSDSKSPTTTQSSVPSKSLSAQPEALYKSDPEGEFLGLSAKGGEVEVDEEVLEQGNLESGIDAIDVSSSSTLGTTATCSGAGEQENNVQAKRKRASRWSVGEIDEKGDRDQVSPKRRAARKWRDSYY